MLTQQTVTHLRSLRLDGMARAFEEQLTQPVASGLAFEDRFGLLVDRELAWRDTRRLERLLKQAKLKYADACVEDLDTRNAVASIHDSSRALPDRTGFAADKMSSSPVPPAWARRGSLVRWAKRPAAMALPCSIRASAACSKNCGSHMVTAASAADSNNSPRLT